MLFDGAATPSAARSGPTRRAGLGLEFKHQDAERFKVWSAGESP